MPPSTDACGASRVLRRAPREGSPKPKNPKPGALARASALCALWARAPDAVRVGGGRPEVHSASARSAERALEQEPMALNGIARRSAAATIPMPPCNDACGASRVLRRAPREGSPKPRNPKTERSLEPRRCAPCGRARQTPCASEAGVQKCTARPRDQQSERSSRSEGHERHRDEDRLQQRCRCRPAMTYVERHAFCGAHRARALRKPKVRKRSARSSLGAVRLVGARARRRARPRRASRSAQRVRAISRASARGGPHGCSTGS
jgi:hypothetical protein